MSSKKKVLAICGSTRAQSVNHLILTTVKKLYKDIVDIDVFQKIIDLPHFNPDVDDLETTVEVVNFRRSIEQADGVLICTPEYVFSIPGVLKNALEWTVSTTIFSNKPVAIIVASGLGEKAFESLLLIMKTLGATMNDDAQLLIPGARSKFNLANNTVDPETLSNLHKLMNGFNETMHT